MIRDLMRQRGVEEPEALDRFLKPQYEALADPFLLSDMEPAVRRIIRAISAGEQVAVYGDYDIDGVSSTALMAEVLQFHGLQPLTYIPDRYREGYGLHIPALEALQGQGATLVISVDCGITAVAEAAWAKERGIDVIITDHHEVPEELPGAVAVINPHQSGDRYPFKQLAGVGVAFALARALQARTGIPVAGQEKWLLDLVALGTVCDVMPLIGENRTMVKYGLTVLRKTRRVGMVALAQSAGMELPDARAHHLGFVFGPRMNAAGRMEHANYSLELLSTKDPVVAQAMAFQLEELNHQRRLEQKRILREAQAQAETYASDPVLVVGGADWPHGVVGIVASKLAEIWLKPTLVLQINADGSAKGSGRSAGDYNLIEALRSSADLFTKLGGHHFAAGFTLPEANIDALRTQLCAHHAASQTVEVSPIAYAADIVVEDCAELSWSLLGYLDELEPFGAGNTLPVFKLQNVKVVGADAIGKDKTHLKLRLADASGNIMNGTGFGMIQKFPNLKAGQTISVLAHLQKNDFNGKSSLQLAILDIQ